MSLLLTVKMVNMYAFSKTKMINSYAYTKDSSAEASTLESVVCNTYL